jgi:hypothetical protein
MIKMSVFRVERTRDYTVMSNHHLRNKQLSLKAKGLMSLVLSLPDDWDYTLQGLARISLEKIDAVRKAVKELECEGYIIRGRERDEHGKLRGTEYIIREQPISDLPTLEKPTLEKPTLDNPTLEKPTLENPTEININNKLNINKLNTDLSNTQSIPFGSESGTEARETDGIEKIAVYERLIKENIEYEIISQRSDKARLDEIVALMVETACGSRKTIRVASDDFPAELVKRKLLQLNSAHIEFVLDCLKENTTKIRNIKQYLLTALFNAPSTIENYYTSLVNRDLSP